MIINVEHYVSNLLIFPFQRSASFVRQQISYPPIKCNRSRRTKARSPYHGCQDSYDSGIHTSDHEIFVWCVRIHRRASGLLTCSIYASVVPVKNSVWIPVIIPESCYENFQEIHRWIITKQTVGVPRCVRTFKLNIILWLVCKYLWIH